MVEQTGCGRSGYVIYLPFFIGLVILCRCTNGATDISDGLVCDTGVVAKRAESNTDTGKSEVELEFGDSCKSKKCHYNKEYGEYICGEPGTKPAKTGEFQDGLSCEYGTSNQGREAYKNENSESVKKEYGKNCKSGNCYVSKERKILCGTNPNSGSIPAGSGWIVVMTFLFFFKRLFKSSCFL